MSRITSIIRRAQRRRQAALKRGNSKVARSALRVARRWRAIRRMSVPSRVLGFDGAPVNQGLAAVLQDARAHGAFFTVVSGDRRRGVAERFGKKSQAALFNCWVARVPGCNPANPPGRSTHELRSDGVAYRGPVGRKLSWWQLGLDISGATSLLATLDRLGYKVRRPYPDGREAHHLNFTANPRANYIRRHS